MEWYRLPPERAQRASIRLIGGPLYHAAEIARLDYRPTSLTLENENR
jgi:hypothetical protein